MIRKMIIGGVVVRADCDGIAYEIPEERSEIPGISVWDAPSSDALSMAVWGGTGGLFTSGRHWWTSHRCLFGTPEVVAGVVQEAELDREVRTSVRRAGEVDAKGASLPE